MASQAAWHPQMDVATFIVNMLGESLKSQVDNVSLEKAYRELENLRQRPDFLNYLLFIFNSDQPVLVRQSAGLYLKNIIAQAQQFSPETHDYLQSGVLQSIGDQNADVRNTVGTLISTIIRRGPEASSSLIPVLGDFLAHPQDEYVHGALNALDKLCEDFCRELQQFASPQLQEVIPKVIEKFHSPHEIFRIHALNTINQFLLQSPVLHEQANLLVLQCPILEPSFELYMKGVFHLANDSSVEVRQLVCIAFSGFIQRCLMSVQNYLNDMIDYMIKHTTTKVDSRLSLEACEFWSTLANTHVVRTALPPYLPVLIPTLVNAMVYSDLEVSLLVPEENDGMTPDKQSEIGRRYRSLRTTGSRSQDEERLADPSGWTLRKCAAQNLDTLAFIFPDDILPHLVPLLKAKGDGNWKELESSILAIGAVARGCSELETMCGNLLPQFVPYMVENLRHPRPLVRTISCWSLTRYSPWICKAGQSFHPVLEGLLQCVLDKNKKVQESACSSLATFVEEALDLVNPHLEPILRHLMQAFHTYQAKNFLILLDALNTVVSVVGMQMQDPKLRDMVIVPLLQKWNLVCKDESNPDINAELRSIMDCLTSLAIYLKSELQPYAKGIFDTCLHLMKASLEYIKEDPEEQHPKDVLIGSIDLVDGMVEGFEENIRGLIGGSPLGDLIVECINVEDPSISQITFALVGDLSKNYIDFLKPGMNQLLHALIHNLDPQYTGVCNNATWAIGDIAAQVGGAMEPFIEAILERFVGILQNERPPVLLASVCYGVGRLCLAATAKTAEYLPQFIVPWCQNIVYTSDDQEKESAYRGICAVVMENPKALLSQNHFMVFCECFARYRGATPGLFISFSFFSFFFFFFFFFPSLLIFL